MSVIYDLIFNLGHNFDKCKWLELDKFVWQTNLYLHVSIRIMNYELQFIVYEFFWPMKLNWNCPAVFVWLNM